MKILVTSFLFFIFSGSFAQRLDLNLFLGASNYQGDLQDKLLSFRQAHPAGGIGFSYNLSTHLAVRVNFKRGKISGDDKKGRNKNRNLNFSSQLTEGELDLQYFITPLGQYSLTPYAFAGVGVYHFDPYTKDSNGKKYFLKFLSTEGEGFVANRKAYSLTQLAIPFGAGVKLPLSDNLNVGLEVGFRKGFTDYLDDVSSSYVDENVLFTNRGEKAVELSYRGDEVKGGNPNYPVVGSQRGNPKNKDWYYFTGITLSFRLLNGNISSRQGLACPKDVY